MSSVRHDFAPSGFFVLRTPLLPYGDLAAWWGGLEAPETPTDPALLEQAIDHDRAVLRERLRAAYRRPELLDALFVASPWLEEAVTPWLVGDADELSRKLERALARYLVRACARATPFGLFAGCSVGLLGERTRLEIAATQCYVRHSQLDADYLDALMDVLERAPALRETLVYRPNSSLYRAAGRLRYVQARIEEGDRAKPRRRTHHLVAIEESEYLDTILATAHRGATRAELAEALTREGVHPKHSHDYVDELTDSQVLVPEAGFHVTGRNPLEDLVAQLRQYPAAADAATLLDHARAELEAIDSRGPGVEPRRYRSFATELSRLPARVTLSRLLRVDMTKPAPGATLGTAVVEELARGVEILRRLTRRPRVDELARFREAFQARYEERAVPLAEALDEEVGVGETVAAGLGGEAAPLLAGLPFRAPLDQTHRRDERDALLLRWLSAALRRGERELALRPADLEAIAEPEPSPLPGAFAVTATITAPSQAALDRGQFRLVSLGVHGPSGARVLGRLCHTDSELRRRVQEHLRAEEALEPDAVFAEIVHLPQGKLGNLVHRPLLRDYEIPYLGRSGAPRERQLPVADLVVSVQGESITLRSQRLGRRVIPRLTSAHNFRRSGLAIYRFLCLLQTHGTAPDLFFDWGALADAPFLPRVRAGRLVLARAQWRLAGEELRRLSAARGSELFAAVRALRAERGIPRLVAFAEGDQVVPVDFECILSLESFVDLVKPRDEAILVERYGEPDELCASGPEGVFVHELVVPFVSTEPVRRPTGGAAAWPSGLASSAPPMGTRVNAAASSSRPFRRKLQPGSEWLYAKLYTGTATADRLLTGVVAPLVNQVLSSGAADGWFFVRYGDPNFHLRLRFHGEPDNLHAHALPAVQSALAAALDDGRLWRLEFDTYEREVERYGGREGVLVAERIFEADSAAALAILQRLDPGDAGADERWRMAICGSSALISDLGLDAAQRLSVMRAMRGAFGREHGVDAVFARKLGERLRKERTSLEQLIDPPEDPEHPLAAGFAIVRERSARLRPLVSELQRLERAGRLDRSPVQIVPAYVHMHMNRMMRSASRKHELVVYDFLTRLYESHAQRLRATVESRADGAQPQA